MLKIYVINLPFNWKLTYIKFWDSYYFFKNKLDELKIITVILMKNFKLVFIKAFKLQYKIFLSNLKF